MIEFRPDQPKYEQVAAEIRRRIAAEIYRPGMPIPGEPRLAEEFGVARRTARKALELLIAAGDVYTVRSMGTFVSQPKEAQEQSGE
ncbi:GntR family transcriptional regulator [Nonomuraea sp. bgisy101]|uniref:GntR family transcriptional regulator n=1 Tax=Nonomuraea sp. bgisy101 TaxID=3413784 RepID=UPI003D722A63